MAEYDSAIEPGGSGKIVVTVKTKGIQGRRVKSVRVRSNDPQKPRLNLRVAFHSRAPVEVYPAPMARLTGLTGDEITQTLVLRRTDGESLEITDAVSTRPEIQVALEKVTAETADPPGKRSGARAGDWRVTLSLDDQKRLRSQAGTLKISTNHPERPLLRVPIRVRIRELLSFQPNRLQMRARSGGRPSMRTVTVRHGRREIFDIGELQISGKLPSVAVSRLHPRPSSIQQVQIKVDPAGLDPGVYRGTLTAKTTLDAFPEIRLPIRITVTPPPRQKASAPSTP